MSKAWILIVPVLVGLLLGVAASAQGTTDDKISFDDVFGSDRAPAGRAEEMKKKSSQKQFPGGLDEGDLQVQAALPSASRGAEAVESTGSSATETATPAND